MDRAWVYDLARIDLVYTENVRHFVEEAMRHATREKNSDIFCLASRDKTYLWSLQVASMHLSEAVMIMHPVTFPGHCT
jgi:hypothetical protein